MIQHIVLLLQKAKQPTGYTLYRRDGGRAWNTLTIKQGMCGKLGYVYTIVHYSTDHDYIKRFNHFLQQLNYNWRKYEQYIFHIENNVVALNTFDLATNAYNRINGGRIHGQKCVVCC